jgi:t-SNARE complex subunit (syntaxin)
LFIEEKLKPLNISKCYYIINLLTILSIFTMADNNKTKASRAGAPVTNPMWNKQTELAELKKQIADQDNMFNDIEMGVDKLHGTATDINAASKEQGELIDDLDKDVSGANDRIGGVIGRVKDLISNPGGSCRCYIIIFLVVAFFILVAVIVWG